MARFALHEGVGVLHVRLLGHPDLLCGGRPWRFPAPPKTMPLLAYLLLHRGALARRTLSFVLWPDSPEEKARTDLRLHLHYLQKALPVDSIPWVVSDNESVRWNDDAPY